MARGWELEVTVGELTNGDADWRYRCRWHHRWWQSGVTDVTVRWQLTFWVDIQTSPYDNTSLMEIYHLKTIRILNSLVYINSTLLGIYERYNTCYIASILWNSTLDDIYEYQYTYPVTSILWNSTLHDIYEYYYTCPVTSILWNSALHDINWQWYIISTDFI